MTKSYFRGHETIWKNDMWVYADDKTPLPGWGGKIRPCKKCGALFELHESDRCLGSLPGVDNACCGHGNPEWSYIRFTSGVAVKGFNEIEYTERWGMGPKGLTKEVLNLIFGR